MARGLALSIASMSGMGDWSAGASFLPIVTAASLLVCSMDVMLNPFVCDLVRGACVAGLAATAAAGGAWSTPFAAAALVVDAVAAVALAGLTASYAWRKFMFSQVSTDRLFDETSAT